MLVEIYLKLIDKHMFDIYNNRKRKEDYETKINFSKNK